MKQLRKDTLLQKDIKEELEKLSTFDKSVIGCSKDNMIDETKYDSLGNMVTKIVNEKRNSLSETKLGTKVFQYQEKYIKKSV